MSNYNRKDRFSSYRKRSFDRQERPYQKRYEDRYRDQRRDRRDYRDRREHREQREQKPQPANGMCNPLCPFFWCAKRAYQVRKDPATGRRYVYCTWIGDECIGASCQYASCRMNYMLPDGSCAYAKQQKAGEQRKGLLDEIAEEDLDRRTRDVLHKRFGRRSFDDLL